MKVIFSVITATIMALFVVCLTGSATYLAFAGTCSQKGYLSGSVSCADYMNETGTCDQDNCFGYVYTTTNNASSLSATFSGCSETGGKYDNCESGKLKCVGAYECYLVSGLCTRRLQATSYRGPDYGIDGGDCSSE